MRKYTVTAMLLHWLIALAVLGLIGVGLYMTNVKLSPAVLKLYVQHKSTGLLVLVLMLLRLLWRLRHRPPPLPDTMPRWQLRVSSVVHCTLYLLLFAMPITGWLMHSASGFPLRWYGSFLVPNLIARSSDSVVFWKQAHEVCAWMLIALILLHIVAALKHHFIDRDGLIARMLPARGSGLAPHPGTDPHPKDPL